MVLPVLPEFLNRDEFGEIRLLGHRIGLYHVIGRYNEGFSPEMIACQYPSLPLALIHKVIAFYLENLEPVDEYLVTYKATLNLQQAQTPPLDLANLRRRLDSMRRSQGA